MIAHAQLCVKRTE